MEEEIFDYDDTKFQAVCNKIINEISTAFKEHGFTEEYLKYFREGSIRKEDVESSIHNKLLDLSEFTRHDLNKMWSMLSEKNCWFVDYNIGQIVHEQLLKIWDI